MDGVLGRTGLRLLMCLGSGAMAISLAECDRAGASARSNAAPASVPVVELTAMQLFEEDSSIHRIRDVAVDPQGRVWVVTGSAPFVHVFESGGKLLASFGRSGSASGEIVSPWSLVPPRNRSEPMQLWDHGPHRLLALHPTGMFAASTTVFRSPASVRGDILEASYVHPGRLRRFADGYLLDDYPAGILRVSDVTEMMLVEIDRSGLRGRTVADFRTVGSSVTTSGHVSELFPIVPLWSTCGDTMAVVFDPRGPALSWLDGNLDRRRTRILSEQPRSLTRADLRTYLRYIVAIERRRQQAPPGHDQVDIDVTYLVDQVLQSSSKTAPLVVSLLCESSGTAWLETFATADHPLGYGRRWMVFDRDGGRRSDVVFPRHFRPYHIEGQQAIGVFASPGATPRIARVGISPALSEVVVRKVP